MDDLQHGRETLRMDGDQTSQGNRKRQHPLALRSPMEDIVNQISGGLVHAARVARWADTAALTGRRHQFLFHAAVAP